jgi:hypothetical protein
MLRKFTACPALGTKSTSSLISRHFCIKSICRLGNCTAFTKCNQIVLYQEREKKTTMADPFIQEMFKHGYAPERSSDGGLIKLRCFIPPFQSYLQMGPPIAVSEFLSLSPLIPIKVPASLFMMDQITGKFT